MFVDARRIEEGARVSASVCIIGGGAAGITIALELEERGLDVCVLESGGFKPDIHTRDLYRGENAGIPYSFSDGHRSRFLGGSSNCWGGWCRPPDEHDFEKRSWVQNSGWPFPRGELDPYYRRTHDVLKLGPHNFDPAYWEPAIGRSDVRRLPLDSERLVDTVSQFSPPVRFGIEYRNQLKKSRLVRVILYANVVEIATESSARQVDHLEVATLSGRKFSVSAKYFVLATGGIENARLLLTSDRVQQVGLGNSSDLVGRYFMDHPRLLFGSVRFKPDWMRNKLYDSKFHYQNDAVSANGTRIAAQFMLTRHVQERESLLNSRVWFASVFPGEGSEAAEALIRFKQRLSRWDLQDYTIAGDLLSLMKHPLTTAGFAMARVFQLKWLISDVKMMAVVEPAPDPESRVTLSTERDRLGMNRVKVCWKLGDQVKRTFDRSFEILADELHKQGIADVKLDSPLVSREWPRSLVGTWHHMGTTRMHDSPKHGVVDRDCRVHGMTNLYVAGSSVFPTASANFPTITIVALALRLAEHLSGQLQRPTVSKVMAAA